MHYSYNIQEKKHDDEKLQPPARLMAQLTNAGFSERKEDDLGDQTLIILSMEWEDWATKEDWEISCGSTLGRFPQR